MRSFRLRIRFMTIRSPHRSTALALALFCAVMLAHGAATGADEPSRIPIIEATDVAALREHLGQRIYVMGTVESARWSGTGKVMNIEFNGGQRRGLLAVVFENRGKQFDAAWAGDFSKSITGKRVRLYGEVDEYGGYDEAFKGRPQMILNSPEQVTLPGE